MRIDKKIRALALSIAFAVPGLSHASEAGGVIHPANNDIENVASLQRCARNFINYCCVCHSARYVRYSRLGRDLGLSVRQVIENLMFSAERLHYTLRVSSR